MGRKGPKKRLAVSAVEEEEAKPGQGPIFFHKDWEAFGFLSNYASAPFTAPDPALSRQWPGTKDGDRASSTAEAPSIAFHHSEQYYMYCKAACFGDRAVGQKILAVTKAADCKETARAIKGFNDRVWATVKVRVMEDALWYKFGGVQLEQALRGKDTTRMSRGEKMARLSDLGRRLLATGERHLIEAAGRDRFWGIGYNIKQEPLNYEQSWGKNQLGKSLMATRTRLRALVEGDAVADDE